jgi:hypothetical protein
VCDQFHCANGSTTTVTRLRSLPRLVGGAFLLGQLGWILYEQTRKTRYFCWAPNDYVMDYRLDVRIAGRSLSDEEVLARYHWPRIGRFENVPRHLTDIVEQYERTYGSPDRAHVLLLYRVNNGPQQEWHFS